MAKKVMKTKDRKKIIKTLRLKLLITAELNRDYCKKINLIELENTIMHRFICAYASYIMSKGCDKDKREFKRLMKNICGDDARWL